MSAVVACFNCGGPVRPAVGSLQSETKQRLFHACRCGYLMRATCTPEEALVLFPKEPK